MEHVAESTEVITRLLFQGAGVDIAADVAELENPLFDPLGGRDSFWFAAEPSGDIGTQGQCEQVGPEPLLAEKTVVQARESAGPQFGKPSCRQVKFTDDFGHPASLCVSKAGEAIEHGFDQGASSSFMPPVGREFVGRGEALTEIVAEHAKGGGKPISDR